MYFGYICGVQHVDWHTYGVQPTSVTGFYERTCGVQHLYWHTYAVPAPPTSAHLIGATQTDEMY